MPRPRSCVTLAGVISLAVVSGCASSTTTSGSVQDAGPQPTPRTPALGACPLHGSRSDLPDITLDCLGTGSKVRMSALGGVPLLVNLWASWCAPCKSEMPSLQAASRTYAGKLAFLGIDTKDDVDSAKDFLAATSVHYPQLVDNDGNLLHALGGSGLPITVVLDGTGKVVYQRRGELRADDLAAALKAAGIEAAG